MSSVVSKSPSFRVSSGLRRAFAVSLVALAALLLTPQQASSEDPLNVADKVLLNGVFIAPGRNTEVAEGPLAQIAEDAADRGLLFGIVVPFAPEPTTEAFALRVRQATQLDAVLAFGPDGEIEADTTGDYAPDRTRAIAAARSVGSRDKVEAASAFVDSLLQPPVSDNSGLIDTVIRGVIYLLITLGVVVALEQAFRFWRDRQASAA